MHSSIAPAAHPASAQAVACAFAGPATNPLDACEHLRSSSTYLDPSDGGLSYRFGPERAVQARDRERCEQLRSHVGAADYPCVMARSVFNLKTFRMSSYGALGAAGNAEMLCHDLYEFCSEFPRPIEGNASFIACFDGEAAVDEVAFERSMWTQLRELHAIDRRYFVWASDVDNHPGSPDFSFSAGGRGFFLIGMHPGASRLARRTPMPVIVFNLHEQFVELRSNGKFDGIRDAIQTRDLQLQGSINPMAADFGARSEAAQYSGRAVGRDWVCPFQAGRA